MKRWAHLLEFELKRIKWLIVVAWVGLVLVWSPWVAKAMGGWRWFWPETAEFLGLGGALGFGVAGLFLAIWSGLLERRLSPARPVPRGAIRAVSWGVVMTVLVVPVLVLSVISMWLAGYSGEVILGGFWTMALAVVSVWVGVRFFAKYAGSVKATMAGLVVVACLIVLAESFRFGGLGQPWGNVFGMWLEDGQWVATLVSALMMMAMWRVLRDRGTLVRLSFAILSIVSGWKVMFWVATERSKASFESEFSEPVKIGEEKWSGRRSGYLTYRVSGEGEGEVTIWEVQNELKDQDGRRYEAAQTGFSKKPFHWVGREAMSAIAVEMLGDEVVFLDNWNNTTSEEVRAILNQNARYIQFAIPKEYVPGEEVCLQGRLLGKRCVVETLVDDLQIGEGATFQSGTLQGEVVWRTGEYEGDPKGMELTLRQPAQIGGLLEQQEKVDDSNWLILLKYPKAGVVVQGDGSWEKRAQLIGGIARWIRLTKFRSSELRKYNVKDEKPVVSIHRVRVQECGFAEVTSDPIVLVEKNERESWSDYRTITIRERDGDGPPPTKRWKQRPDPEAASREEVGAWFREVAYRYQYMGGKRDLAQYAERWGGLFFKVSDKLGRDERRRMGAFAEGAGNEGSKLAIEALGGLSSQALMVVERGWEEAAREKVAGLIENGNRDSEILRLGILLGLEGIEDAVIEGLLEGDSWELYEAARVRLKLGGRIEDILDHRLERVEEVSKKSWILRRHDYHFRSLPWLWLLHEGRKKDLKKCLAWMRKAHEAGNFGFRELDHNQPVRFEALLFGFEKFRDLGNAGKLEAEYFEWDPVLRRWVFNEKGKTK